jgi:hypothetical protein
MTKTHAGTFNIKIGLGKKTMKRFELKLKREERVDVLQYCHIHANQI